MIVFYVFLILIVLLVLHMFALPLKKKRPVILVGVENALFIGILIGAMLFLVDPFYCLAGFILGVFMFYLSPWIIFGVSKDNIIRALQRAILASRSDSENSKNGYIVNNALRITIIDMSNKFHIVIFKNIAYSKKAILTKAIWKKFIQNFFI